MIANPVTLRPLFEADEGIKEVGGPAYLAQLTGSGAAVIGARDFAAQIYDLALLRALIGVGRDLVESALDTSEEVAPLAQIEKAETELYKVAEEGGAEGKAKSFGEATKLAIEMAERALNSSNTWRCWPRTYCCLVSASDLDLVQVTDMAAEAVDCVVSRYDARLAEGSA